MDTIGPNTLPVPGTRIGGLSVWRLDIRISLCALPQFATDTRELKVNKTPQNIAKNRDFTT
jgi:hypothetical protein